MAFVDSEFSSLDSSDKRSVCHGVTKVENYGGISVTKFNNQELISNYPNCTCINPKLNSNKQILCSKSGMQLTEAEGQKPAASQNAERHSGKRHNAKRHNAKT